MTDVPGVREAVALYANGWFPMDTPADPSGMAGGTGTEGDGELPWYAARERATLPLDPAFRDTLRRRLRRDVRACEELTLAVDVDYPAVLDLCAQPPVAGDGIWISPRLKRLYLELHAAGWAHSFELRAPDGALAAGLLGVVLGRAAMLESMRRVLPKAGNALLVATLDHLAAVGMELCDIQLPTPHTERLGAVLLAQEEYERRLAAALR